MTPAEIDELVKMAADWIAQQRDLHRSQALPMTESHRQMGAAFFEPQDLQAVRILQVPRIPNPPFYTSLAARLTDEGYDVIDFSQMAGITFIDTVLVSRDAPEAPRTEGDLQGVLFHEMVHVTQYRILGLEEFADQYVRGAADDRFVYRSIPLEDQAYSLGERAAKGEQFRVEPVLRQMLRRE